MTKLTKKLFMSLCLSLFAVCIGLCGLTINAAHAEDAEAPAEPVVAKFVEVQANQNNTGWSLSPNFCATYLVFDTDFVANQYFSGASNSAATGDQLHDGIYWTSMEEPDVKHYFEYLWIGQNGDSLNTLALLFAGDKVPLNATLYVDAGTKVGDIELEGVTLYAAERGRWQTTKPAEPVVDGPIQTNFVGINDAQNNVKWEYFELWDALYLEFDVDFLGGEYSGPAANPSVSDVNASDWEKNGHPTHDGIYWYSPDDPDNVNYFVRIFANMPALCASGNEYTLCLLNWEKWAEPGDILVIEEGTMVGDVRLPAVTLYCVEGSFATHPEDKSTAHWVVEKPVEPEVPGDSSDPSSSVEPGSSDEPEVPGDSDEPVVPGTSDEPAVPGDSSSEPGSSDAAADSCSGSMGVASVMAVAVIALAGVLAKKKEN